MASSGAPGVEGNGGKGGIATGVLLAGAVVVLALPSAVLAFSTRFQPNLDTPAGGEALKPLPGDTPGARLAPIPVRSLAKGQLYLFTPAKTANRPDRSVTVAVRVEGQAAKTISVYGLKEARVADLGVNSLRISPGAFNLGAARGYHNFAQTLVVPTDTRKADITGLARYSIAPAAGGGDDSRFSPRIILDEKQAAGRAPRTFAGDHDDLVDVGGAYRVTRNLNVTAGVRYSQERDRLAPLATDGKQDNQAVYLGTQFRF